MSTREKRRGFGLVEVLVIVGVLVILGVILFPILTRNTTSDHIGGQCHTNVRQISIAVQIYVQEHNGRYPGANWAVDIQSYVGSDMLFACPSDGATNVSQRVSYGYSGLLLKANGCGVSSDQVTNPTETGLFCDVEPVRAWPGNGIVYGGGLLDNSHRVIPAIRHNGIAAGYCDGHAKLCPCKSINMRDHGDQTSRIFVQANGLGFLNNPAGGLQDFAPPATLEPSTISLGGDPCTRSILLAAAQVWQAKSGASYSSKGFLGQDIREGRTANYLWGIGDGTSQSKNALPIARDAMLIIVSKNCKIPPIVSKQSVDVATIRQSFATGYQQNSVQAYTFHTLIGSRRFLVNAFAKVSKEPLVISNDSTTVRNDNEMLDAVAADPYGIGYCSSAVVDIERVQVLDIVDDQGVEHHFFTQDSKAKLRYLAPAEPEWPFMRTLYVAYGGKAWRKDGSGIVNVMLAPDGAGTQALHDGPLFKGNYYLPE